MADSGLSIDQTPGRWLVSLSGALLCEAGVQAMLTSQVFPLSASMAIAGIGAVLILTAVFWKKLELQKRTFFVRLNTLASHPGLWVTVVISIWMGGQIYNTIREIRINNEMIGLRNDEQSIARVLEHGVLPRHLNKSQQATISSFLSQTDPRPFEMHVAQDDEEAMFFALDIRQALIKGGWTTSIYQPTAVPVSTLQAGVSINFYQTEEHAAKPRDVRSPDASNLVRMALGLAGVRVTGWGTGTSKALAEDQLVIGVGRRRTDIYELTPPESPY